MSHRKRFGWARQGGIGYNRTPPHDAVIHAHMEVRCGRTVTLGIIITDNWLFFRPPGHADGWHHTGSTPSRQCDHDLNRSGARDASGATTDN